MPVQTTTTRFSMRCPALFVLALAFACSYGSASASTCYGRPGNGRLDGGVALPSGGANFSAYSRLGVTLDRNYVHASVRQIVIDAYAAMETTAPAKAFVYGETGAPGGGPFSPHRTHQAGVSVDFMVPVLDRNGKSVPLPASVFNKWGYAHEFDANARLKDLRIDFDAAAEHLYQLSVAAKRHGVTVHQVIFEHAYLPRLMKTTRGPYLKRELKFMKTRPWIRHDEHYHVDFAIPCRPLAEFNKRR